MTNVFRPNFENNDHREPYVDLIDDFISRYPKYTTEANIVRQTLNSMHQRFTEAHLSPDGILDLASEMLSDILSGHVPTPDDSFSDLATTPQSEQPSNVIQLFDR